MTHASIEAEILQTRAAVDAVLADKPLLAAVQQVADVCVAALRTGRKILFCGNGGSAADSQHLAAELVSRLNYDRPGLCAFALTVDTSALTAIGNDYGYERVFSRQVEAVGQPGDVLIAISTSGNSPNVLRALEAAKARGLTTIGKTGKTGGKMAPLCDIALKMPANDTPRVQECHMMLGHIYCALIEDALFGAEHRPKTGAMA
jgi:D-sedoheptulose 7-phosphate isomerase